MTKETIKYMKLTNGQELVATIKSEKGDKVEMLADVPIVFLVAGSGPNQPPVVNVAPFAPFTSKDTIELDRKDIVFLTDSNKELTDFYKQATGKTSILTPPTAGKIITV